jgi:ethanolamine transporter EutH
MPPVGTQTRIVSADMAAGAHTAKVAAHVRSRWLFSLTVGTFLGSAMLNDIPVILMCF